jgi:intracellular septation protein A
VNFKMFGLTLLAFAGVFLQLLWLAARTSAAPSPCEPG